MANSKHAHLRYNILDYCFRKKALNFNQLLAYVNNQIEKYYPEESISERTLREDLKLFRDHKQGFGAPLPNKVRVLKYDTPNFSIATKPLLEYEQYLIEAAQQLLQRFENHPKYEKLAEALLTFQEEEDQDNQLSKVLFYDYNKEYKGIKHLKPLYLAIKKKQVLQITFLGFNNSESKIFEFHPYVLKQYNRRWFVFGLNKTKNIAQWSIPLDERLLNFEVLEDANFMETATNWESFFRPMIGVVKPVNATIEKIILRFYNGREQYFKTKPLHPDYEEFFEKDKQNQIWFEAIINKELVQQLLSYGQDVEVIAPERLKLKMKEHVENMQNYYS
ncbi:WYL domain-containing protein [Tenacibaculum sp. 190524A02b]|uniref:helix-turn-helix transcriptional regulator n=1 Tax=Tenacibaculum vairaonense TaxID=3137860 RepID=UPI0031FAE92B